MQTKKQLINKQLFESNKGFTLAEVLVTLAIIGIVAALNIPTLIQNSQNDAIVTRVKKAYSTFQQAYNSFIADGTTMDTIFAGNNASVLNQFSSKLNVVKSCGTAIGSCFPNVKYKKLYDNGGIDWVNLNQQGQGTAILADGSSFIIASFGNCNDNRSGGNTSSPLYHVCGQFDIDINGHKGPNQLGKDLFMFWIAKTGIFPRGSNGDGYNCTINDWGYGCASKVLTDGAVNY